MTNKEELIKWMTEKREGLTLEKKVQFLWDFWQNKNKFEESKDQINNLLNKFGVSDLYQLEINVEELITVLDSKVSDINLILNKYSVTDLNHLAQEIEIALQTRDRYREERNQSRKEITEKEDRIAQLDYVVRGSALIFQRQQQVIDQLTEKLQKEQGKNQGNVEYQSHLQTDIKRLAKEGKELTQRIKELAEEEEKNKLIRDKELADLRKERDDRPNITLNEWNTYQQQLSAVQSELAKEKGWWDKWFNDYKVGFLNVFEEFGRIYICLDNDYIIEIFNNNFSWNPVDSVKLSHKQKQKMKNIYERYKDK